MGIRFHCPNGHKLHVKAFLAGKRGVCPDCGAKFLIPNGLDEGGAQTVAASTGDEMSAAPPAEKPVPPTMREAADDSPVDVSDEANRAKIGPTPCSGPDLIAESPHSVWYVRVSGEQFGPVQGEVLRQWLAQGRISPHSDVWREGWEQWRSGEVLLPTDATPPAAEAESTTNLAVAVPDVLPAPLPGGVGISTSHRLDQRQLRRRKLRRWVAFLSVACLLLLFLLVWVVKVRA